MNYARSYMLYSWEYMLFPVAAAQQVTHMHYVAA